MQTRNAWGALVALSTVAGVSAAAVVSDLETQFLNPPQPGVMLDATGQDIVTLDISGMTLDDAQGFSDAVYDVLLDPMSRIVGVGWDIEITTTEAGKLIDFQFMLGALDAFGEPVDGVLVQPSSLPFAAIDGFRETSDDDGFTMRDGALPIIDLEALGMDFTPEGGFSVELYNQFPGEAITLGDASFVYLAVERVVPTPAGLAAFALACGAAVRRRR